MLFKDKAAGEGSISAGYWPKWIYFFQETKETRWVLAANILTNTFFLHTQVLWRLVISLRIQLSRTWRDLGSNVSELGIWWDYPKFLLVNSGGAYCSILAFLFVSYQLSFSSGPNALCWDVSPSRHWLRAHDFIVRPLLYRSLFNANEIHYLASNLFISGCSLASYSPRCPVSICAVCVSFK